MRIEGRLFQKCSIQTEELQQILYSKILNLSKFKPATDRFIDRLCWKSYQHFILPKPAEKYGNTATFAGNREDLNSHWCAMANQQRSAQVLRQKPGKP